MVKHFQRGPHSIVGANSPEDLAANGPRFTTDCTSFMTADFLMDLWLVADHAPDSQWNFNYAEIRKEGRVVRAASRARPTI